MFFFHKQKMGHQAHFFASGAPDITKSPDARGFSMKERP